MTTMVERVARAMAACYAQSEVRLFNPSGLLMTREEYVANTWPFFEWAARAVLKEMREPTEGMAEAAHDAANNCMEIDYAEENSSNYLTSGAGRAAYQAAIDAALAEEAGK